MSSTPHSRSSTMSTVSRSRQPSVSHRMHRQDSGYESQASCSRRSRKSLAQHPSDTSLSLRRSKTRASTKTTATSTSVTTSMTHRYMGSQTSVTYTYPSIASPFDRPDDHQRPPLFPFAPADLTRPGEDDAQASTMPLPPPTTHYWTSDDTRRIEYAEIDAANSGLAGWLRRHVLPDCFSGCAKHLAFDDDSGSVRRYRLDLDDKKATGGPAAKPQSAKRRRHLSVASFFSRSTQGS